MSGMDQELALCTTREVAAMAAVDTSTVRRWVEKRLIVPAIITPGGHYRFNRAYIEQQLSNMHALAASERGVA